MTEVMARPVPAPQPVHRTVAKTEAIVKLQAVSVSFNNVFAIRDITLDFPRSQISALIGPSGCGKTTLLRAINRMHDAVPGAKVTGSVRLGEIDVYGGDVDPVLLRSRIGMVFQRPNPFPTLNIYDNVVSGLRFNGIRKKSVLDDAAEEALKSAVLWDEVHHKLRTSAVALSGGQQQRLCIARALAVEPEVLLMDEPTASLDPIATLRIEELLSGLRALTTVIIVTHNLQQAARVSEYCAFLLLNPEGRFGELVEADQTVTLFSTPSDRRTEDYITGRFG
jgi:phosphate transport system ATP-binding protein